MGLREDLLRKADKKRAEIAEFEAKAREGRAYLQGIEDTIRMLPRAGASDGSMATTLRAGTLLARTHVALKKVGQPMHINDLLNVLGKQPTRNNKAGLSGTLAAYVRRGEIFNRTAPNTFGLIEWGGSANGDSAAPEEDA